MRIHIQLYLALTRNPQARLFFLELIEILMSSSSWWVYSRINTSEKDKQYWSGLYWKKELLETPVENEFG